jgi:hypothetical protein
MAMAESNLTIIEKKTLLVALVGNFFLKLDLTDVIFYSNKIKGQMFLIFV